MPRIPTSELDRLKREVSLLRLMQSQGHELKKRGKDWVMRCVFHDDATASLVVSEGKNLYHCFGCGAGGSVLDWVMKTQSLSLPHAVAVLKQGGELDASPHIGVAQSHKRHLLPLAASPDAVSDQALLHQVMEYYHSTLKQSPEALAYLAERGLNHPELVDTFKLGYANKSITYRIPAGYTQSGKDFRVKLRELGVYRDSGHEHLNGCLIVPVVGLTDGANQTQAAQVMQLYGRRIVPNSKIPAGQPRHLYLARPLLGVWNEVALIGNTEIILCESLIDAMTFWCAGFRHVVAAYGVNGFTVDHVAAFKYHGTQRVLIAYDRDDAGDTAALKLAEELSAIGIESYRVLFPKGMDANSYAKKVQPASQSLALVLRDAQWLGTGQPPSESISVHSLNYPSSQSSNSQSNHSPIPSASSLAASAVKTVEALPQKATAPALAKSSSYIPAPIEPQSEQMNEAKGELLLTIGDRVWRIRGWQKNLSPEQMRVNVQVRRGDGLSDEVPSLSYQPTYYIDTLDIYAARQRAVYIKQAGLELGLAEDVIKQDLGRVLLKLESLQDANLAKTLSKAEDKAAISPEDETAALALLKSPDLIARVTADMQQYGVVGESSNVLAGYLAAVSRKLDTPLAVLIQSSSAAGKSSLMDAVLNLIPAEERIQYSAMTGQSLFYLGETDLQHKILAIAEEEGVRQAAYALKLLQSDGELTIASTGKDETTGNLITKQYRVKGPVMLMLTTTAIDVDEELLNRCLVLTVNESREQTQAIHARQRSKQTLAGLLMNADRDHILTLHQNAQRLIKKIHVVNPYADQLTFLDDKTRTRRDHMKYLTLIRAITLLHQYQRPIKRVQHRGETLEYIEVSKADIALANQIAHGILGRTLDELPPQARRLLQLVQQWVQTQCVQLDMKQAAFRFTRKQVREMSGFGDTQLKLYLAKLTELEYLIGHFNGRRQAIEYELLYDAKQANPNNNGDEKSSPHMMGLIDLDTLDLTEKTAHSLHNIAEWSDKNTMQSDSGRVEVGIRSVGGRLAESDMGQSV